MASKFRFAPLYFKQKKIGELETVELQVMSGDEQMIGTEGLLGHSEGAITCKLTAGCVIPVGGTTPAMIDALLNKEDVDIGLPIDGGTFKFTGRLTGVTYNSESKSGSTKGKFEISTGKPTKV